MSEEKNIGDRFKMTDDSGEQSMVDSQQSIEEPLTTYNLQPTTRMEVHHHPQVEKKSFKEYLLEGLMIFIAVTMGFIAESIRENITKHEREHHLMEMQVEDLKADLPRLDSAIVRNTLKMNRLDTLRLLICDATVKPLPNSDYRLMYFLHRMVNFTTADFIATKRTVTQFEKNDGFGLIRKQTVSDSINYYYQVNEGIVVQQNYHREYLNQSYQLSQSIFDIRILNDYVTRADAPLMLQSNRPFNLLTKDTNTLLLCASKLYTARGTLFLSINAYKSQKARTERLIALIEKEYHLKKE